MNNNLLEKRKSVFFNQPELDELQDVIKSSGFDIYKWYISVFYFFNIIGLLTVVIICRDMPAYSVYVNITGFAVDSVNTYSKESN